jgi:hypothetical protein
MDHVELLQQEIFSPDIEEFSESDDIFHMSQEGAQIVTINNEIEESYQKKSKYRPMNKFPKPGGLLEKLRVLSNTRLANGCAFAKSNVAQKNQRKIQVIQHCEFRRRLLIMFRFTDSAGIPELEEKTHLMTLSSEFNSFLSKHSFYDVIFDLPQQEFAPNHLVHFCKLIKAAKMY